MTTDTRTTIRSRVAMLVANLARLIAGHTIVCIHGEESDG